MLTQNASIKIYTFCSDILLVVSYMKKELYLHFMETWFNFQKLCFDPPQHETDYLFLEFWITKSWKVIMQYYLRL